MIEVGEYVRTKQGKIAKLIEIDKNNYYWFDNWIYKESGIPHQGFRIEDIERIEILKHSKNIIDLIEVGDYVNGKYVSEIKEYEKSRKTLIALIGIIMEDDMKTILTKEQYMQNCYKTDTN